MKIDISGISEGAHQYDLSASTDDLGLESNFKGDVAADITLEKSIYQILVRVNASVKGVFICDRCAEEFSDIVKTTFRSVYSWEQNEEKENNEDDDFHLLGKDDNTIDLSTSIKDYIRLAVPIKLLCSNNCTIPEHDTVIAHAVDPRWQKLQTLIRSEKN